MIKNIIKNQTSFEGVSNVDKFYNIFTSLYNLPSFKNGLDLILTKMDQKDLNFEIKIIKNWDTNVGCYLTEQNKIYNKFLNKFSNKFRHKIIIKNLLVNVVAHEMAHALEVESNITLNQEFRQAISFDMKNRKPNNLALFGSIKRLMIEEVKPYPNHQIISELFARYFELLSISRDVEKSGDFQTLEVINFFENTSKWITEIFNPKIKNKINPQIASYTTKMINLGSYKKEKTFTDKVNSFHKKTDETGKKSWGANVKSNASWHKSWQNHNKTIEDKNKNLIE